jgi:predicted ester cyclase
MSNEERNKKRLREFIQVVWEQHDLSALPTFWTADCMNHASPEPNNVGLSALLAYHEGFITGFLPAFSNPRIEFLQQVAEGDRVVSQMVFTARHTGSVFGKAPTGKIVSLASIRIDRFEGDKIAEHWSVADMAGFTEQLQLS